MAVERPWTLTLRQYEQALMDDYMARTGDQAVSKAEYRRCYPNDCRRREWLREIEVAAQHGEIIPRKVMDALFNSDNRVGLAILRYIRDRQPDYMPPYVRARQKALKRDEIEMKRRVRSMVRGG